MKKYSALVLLFFLCIGCNHVGSGKSESILPLLLEVYQAKSIAKGKDILINKGYKLSRKTEANIFTFSSTKFEFEGDYLISLSAIDGAINQLTCQSKQKNEINQLRNELIEKFNFKLDQQYFVDREDINTGFYSNDKITAKVVTIDYKDGKNNFCSINLKSKNGNAYLKSF